MAVRVTFENNSLDISLLCSNCSLTSWQSGHFTPLLKLFILTQRPYKALIPWAPLPLWPSIPSHLLSLTLLLPSRLLAVSATVKAHSCLRDLSLSPDTGSLSHLLQVFACIHLLIEAHSDHSLEHATCPICNVHPIPKLLTYWKQLLGCFKCPYLQIDSFLCLYDNWINSFTTNEKYLSMCPEFSFDKYQYCT